MCLKAVRNYFHTLFVFPLLTPESFMSFAQGVGFAEYVVWLALGPAPLTGGKVRKMASTTRT